VFRIAIAISQIKNVILNQIVENKPFENYVFKKLRFEKADRNYFFKSQAIGCFFENAEF
jgi:hypothetical protein